MYEASGFKMSYVSSLKFHFSKTSQFIIRSLLTNVLVCFTWQRKWETCMYMFVELHRLDCVWRIPHFGAHSLSGKCWFALYQCLILSSVSHLPLWSQPWLSTLAFLTSPHYHHDYYDHHNHLRTVRCLAAVVREFFVCKIWAICKLIEKTCCTKEA